MLAQWDFAITQGKNVFGSYSYILITRKFAQDDTCVTRFTTTNTTQSKRFILLHMNEKLYAFEWKSGEITLSRPTNFSDGKKERI